MGTRPTQTEQTNRVALVFLPLSRLGLSESAVVLACIWHLQTGPRQSSRQQEETLLRVATVDLPDSDQKRRRASRRVRSLASYLVMYVHPTSTQPLLFDCSAF